MVPGSRDVFLACYKEHRMPHSPDIHDLSSLYACLGNAVRPHLNGPRAFLRSLRRGPSRTRDRRSQSETVHSGMFALHVPNPASGVHDGADTDRLATGSDGHENEKGSDRRDRGNDRHVECLRLRHA